jgi:hypothetical protein
VRVRVRLEVMAEVSEMVALCILAAVADANCGDKPEMRGRGGRRIINITAKD